MAAAPMYPALCKIEINPLNSGKNAQDIRTPPIVHLGVYTDTCFILVRKTVVGFSHLEVSGDQPLLALGLPRLTKRRLTYEKAGIKAPRFLEIGGWSTCAVVVVVVVGGGGKGKVCLCLCPQALSLSSHACHCKSVVYRHTVTLGYQGFLFFKP